MHLPLLRLTVCVAAVLLFGQSPPSLAQTVAPPAPISPAPATSPSAASASIAVNDSARLKASIGKTALVTGTVSAISVSRNGHRQVKFKEGMFRLYISRKDFDAHPGWKIESLIGKTIFAGGEVAPFYDKVEMLVRRPEQIADAADKIDLAAAGSPASATKPSGAGGSTADNTPGVEVKKTSATIGQISAVVQGAPQPFLAFERFEGVIEPGYRGGGVPVIIESYSGKDRTSPIAGLEIVREARGWPKSRVLRLKRAQGGKPGPGLPQGLAVALLLDSMFDGWVVPEKLAVSGTFLGVGSLAGGREELLLLKKSPLPEATLLLVPDGAETGLADLALEREWEVLLKHTVLGAKDLEDAVRIAKALGAGTWNPVFARFAETVGVLKQDPATRVKSPAVRARLQEIANACPEHLTARVLLSLGSKDAPVTYSSTATGLKLRQFYAKVTIEAKALRSAKDGEGKKRLRALEEEFQLLAPHCHPDWKRFQGVLTEWLEILRDSLRFDSKDTSSRARKNADAMKVLTEKAKAENEEAVKFRQ